MKISSRSLAIVISLLLATSCESNISKQWTCRKVDSKLGCVSISEADQAYSSGIPGDIFKRSEVKGSGKYSSFSGGEVGSDAKLIRTADQVGRIWLVPYMDADSNYHESSFVRVVDEISKWEVTNIKKNFSETEDESNIVRINLAGEYGVEVDND